MGAFYFDNVGIEAFSAFIIYWDKNGCENCFLLYNIVEENVMSVCTKEKYSCCTFSVFFGGDNVYVFVALLSVYNNRLMWSASGFCVRVCRHVDTSSSCNNNVAMAIIIKHLLSA